MKKFSFTLQSVHDVREMMHDKESMTMHQLQTEAEQAASQVSEIEKLRLQALDDYTLRLHSNEQITATEMELNSNHFAALNRLQQLAEANLASKREECRQQGEKVASARRQVKVTDQLRENQRVRHTAETLRYEQNAIDEIISTRFARTLTNRK